MLISAYSQFIVLCQHQGENKGNKLLTLYFSIPHKFPLVVYNILLLIKQMKQKKQNQLWCLSLNQIILLKADAKEKKQQLMGSLKSWRSITFGTRRWYNYSHVAKVTKKLGRWLIIPQLKTKAKTLLPVINDLLQITFKSLQVIFISCWNMSKQAVAWKVGNQCKRIKWTLENDQSWRTTGIINVWGIMSLKRVCSSVLFPPVIHQPLLRLPSILQPPHRQPSLSLLQC